MTTEKTASALSDLAAQSANAARSEAEIMKSAQDRRAVVQATLDRLRPLALTDERAAEDYENAVTERAHLDLVISRSRAPG